MFISFMMAVLLDQRCLAINNNCLFEKNDENENADMTLVMMMMMQ